MIRNALLPALAIAMLSGCATDYSYRNGSGDYYYGQPQVEYRHIGGYGGYGSYGAYGGYGGYAGYGGYGYGIGYSRPVYYYDRFGRLVYGHPYSAYRAPYPGNYWRYQPRPHRPGGGHDDHDHHDGNDGERADRRPPWRNIRGGVHSISPVGRVEARDTDRLRQSPAPFVQMAPRPQAGMPSARPDNARPITGIRSGMRSERTPARAANPVDDVE